MLVLWGLLATIASPAEGAVRWGINPGMAGADDLAGSPYAQQAAASMAAIGLREARYIAPWSTADPVGTADAPGGSYVWDTYFDTVAMTLARNGIRWNPVFAYPPYNHAADPTGVGGGNPSVSSHPNFANFVEAFARRYGPGGRFWSENPSLPELPVTDYEIWNEPNLPGVWANEQGAPQEYMDLYATAYSAIKRVDSGARVMFGAFTPSPEAWSESWFLAASVAHRPQQPIDAVSYHPNTIGIGTYGAVDHVYRLIRPFRAQMDALGLADVPMSITELAWGSDYSIFPDSTVRLTESERAAAMATVGRALANSDCNINMVAMLYWGTDREITDPAGDPRRYLPTIFALANPDNSLKPIGQAYRAVIQTRPGEQEAICHPDGTDPAGNTDPTPAARVDTRSPTAVAPSPQAAGPAEIARALEADLASIVRRLRRVRTRKLLRKRRVTLAPLKALVAGRFSATLTRSPRNKRAILARGSCQIHAAAPCPVRLRLTPTGRRLFRRGTAPRLTLTIKFRGAARHAARKHARFTLRR